jgi:glycosyltransferase involved in cell wall biosynthesis
VVEPLRIGFLGGVPPAIGGAGLEIQMERTAAALEARGHTVVRIARAARGDTWDVTHAFGAEGDVQHYLDHWTRARTPLVLSPVIVASPGLDEAAVVLGSRVRGIATHAGLRRRALLRAQALVAITEYERRVISRLVGGSPRIEVVANGVDPVEPAPADDDQPGGHILLLGAVSDRKRQREVVSALGAAGEGGIVIAGGFAGPADELPAWEAAVEQAGARWLGQVADPAVVARLQRDASVLVHVSRAEVQSLAVIETLAQGTPVVLSDIPSHRELAARYPAWVRLAREIDDVLPGVRELRIAPPPGGPPWVPSWDDVAQRLEGVYRSLLP